MNIEDIEMGAAIDLDEPNAPSQSKFKATAWLFACSDGRLIPCECKIVSGKRLGYIRVTIEEITTPPT